MSSEDTGSACCSSDDVEHNNGSKSTQDEETKNALNRLKESAGRATFEEEPLNILVIGIELNVTSTIVLNIFPSSYFCCNPAF